MNSETNNQAQQNSILEALPTNPYQVEENRNQANQIAELREELIRLNIVLNQALLNQRSQPEQVKHEPQPQPKIAMPEKYKGPKDSTPVNTWVAQTKNYLNYFHCLYTTKGASIVQSLLKDEAATWHNHQVQVMTKEYNTGAEIL